MNPITSRSYPRMATPTKADVQRQRVSGYCGYIPGLSSSLQVNTTEYADWEYNGRTASSKNQSPNKQHVIHDLSQLGNKPDSGAFQPKIFAPRNRVMGYKGYVPGLRYTVGVINSDYQNEEYRGRKEHDLTMSYPSSNGETIQILRVESNDNQPYKKNNIVAKKQHPAISSLQQESSSNCCDPKPRRSQSAGHARPSLKHEIPPLHKSSRPSSSSPQSTPSYQPFVVPDASNRWLLETRKDPYTVEEYLEIPRACTYSGFIPRKRFTVGI